jgi:hypothetical protein
MYVIFSDVFYSLNRKTTTYIETNKQAVGKRVPRCLSIFTYAILPVL